MGYSTHFEGRIKIEPGTQLMLESRGWKIVDDAIVWGGGEKFYGALADMAAAVTALRPHHRLSGTLAAYGEQDPFEPDRWLLRVEDDGVAAIGYGFAGVRAFPDTVRIVNVVPPCERPTPWVTGPAAVPHGFAMEAALAQAAGTGDAVCVRRLVADGASADAAATALCFAAPGGFPEVVDMLLQVPGVVTSVGAVFALQWAVELGRSRAVQRLLTAGVPLEFGDLFRPARLEGMHHPEYETLLETLAVADGNDPPDPAATADVASRQLW
ncbi:MAG: hypothetical protein IT198_12650 [Acidimicrobiia bacterium]|nr:hypothetical protein [Acidimicrobiia bacterium]